MHAMNSSGTSQIHSRQVTANTTVETAVVEAPSLTALVNALKQPVCWAPLLAIVLVLIGVRVPDQVLDAVLEHEAAQVVAEHEHDDDADESEDRQCGVLGELLTGRLDDGDEQCGRQCDAPRRSASSASQCLILSMATP